MSAEERRQAESCVVSGCKGEKGQRGDTGPLGPQVGLPVTALYLTAVCHVLCSTLTLTAAEQYVM